MRCEVVTRELASPTGTVSPADLAEHLAACPGCAEWSRRSAQLDRVWEATRPLDPTPRRLDALWLAASDALDRQDAVATDARPLTLPARPSNRARRRWTIGLAAVGLAQAAALLLLAFLPGRPTDRPAGPQIGKVTGVRASTTPTLAPVLKVNASAYQMSIVRIDEARVDTIDSPPADDLVAENSPFLAFSAMESQATP